jgi:hypothetical protein
VATGAVVMGAVVMGAVVMGAVVMGAVVMGAVVMGVVLMGAVVMGAVVMGAVLMGAVVIGVLAGVVGATPASRALLGTLGAVSGTAIAALVFPLSSVESAVVVPVETGVTSSVHAATATMAESMATSVRCEPLLVGQTRCFAVRDGASHLWLSSLSTHPPQ